MSWISNLSNLPSITGCSKALHIEIKDSIFRPVLVALIMTNDTEQFQSNGFLRSVARHIGDPNRLIRHNVPFPVFETSSGIAETANISNSAPRWDRAP